jgi:hypothetical protein
MLNIQNLDLEPIKVKLMDREDSEIWSYERVQTAEVKYRNFLSMHLENPKKTIVPTKDVDKFWHYHILDTQKYAQDCASVFGYFLHHFPYMGMGGEKDANQLRVAFERTQAKYRQNFGHDFVDETFGHLKVKSLNKFSICDSSLCGADTISAAARIRPEFEDRVVTVN